jgi:hypothetical protein
VATLIEFFAVPPSRDTAFLADWARERAAAGATLYRAIREETPVRFVSVGPGGSHALVQADGDVDGAGGVIRITAFAAADTTAWEPAHAIERERRGYLGTRLYRGPDGYVAIARWSSPLMVARTELRPEFARAVAAFPATPASALYARAAGV